MRFGKIILKSHRAFNERIVSQINANEFKVKLNNQ